MQKTVVITGAGKDRVGIVAELSDFLYKLGCNLLDSSMTLLRGEFALILMTTLPENMTVEELRCGLKKIEEKLGLNFSIRELAADEISEKEEPHFQYFMSVYGADRPGIVAGVSQKLAELNLNITDVQTKSVKQADREIFVMMLELSSQTEISATYLQEQMTLFSASLGVDVSVREIEIMEL